MTNHWKNSAAGSWSGRTWTRDQLGGCRADPYLVWAEATGFRDMGGKPPKWVPIIIRLLHESSAVFARSMARHRNWIRIPAVYRYPSAGLENTRYCTATVTREFFARLNGTLKGRISRFEIGLPVISTRDAGNPRSDYPVDTNTCRNIPRTRQNIGANAIVGVIDDGLAFAHERFREPGARTTRIEYFWNQDIPDRGTPGLGYGRELAKKDINDMLRESTHAGLVDEDEVYRRARYEDVRRRIAHGTHVMDLACGAEPAKSGDSPRIICVQFKMAGRNARDTSGLWLAVRALDGLRYILDRGDNFFSGALDGPCPVIVNLSYGYIAGPHDGTSMLERAIKELITLRKNLAVVIPAGNSHLAQCHARFSLRAGATREIKWRIIPDDATPSFMEIWLPSHEIGSAITVEVTTPSGEASGPMRRGEVRILKPGHDALCTVVYLRRVATGNRGMILVAIAPTGSPDTARETAPAGEWTICITNHGKREIEVNAWIQRDDTPYGFPMRGRQSRFEDPHYARFDEWGREIQKDNQQSYVKRAGTINSIATGRETLVVAGFRRSDGAAGSYSADGGVDKRNAMGRLGPDVMAASDDSAAHRGVLAAGARSGSTVMMNGTSVAAPQIVRWLWEHGKTSIDSYKAISTEQLRAIVDDEANDQEHARGNRAANNRGLTPKPTKTRGGAGRIDTAPLVHR